MDNIGLIAYCRNMCYNEKTLYVGGFDEYYNGIFYQLQSKTIPL